MLAAAVVVGANLGGHALWDPDEAKHAEIAREMLVNERWIEPTSNHEPYHDKPSLIYLLVGLCYRALGLVEVAARLVPAGAGWLTIVLVYVWSARRRVEEGLLAATLLASSAFFVYVTRFLNFDALLTCVSMLSILALARAVECKGRARGLVYGFYAFTALAVLVKGPIAVVLAGAPLLMSLRRGDMTLAEVQPARGLALFMTIVALWMVPALLVAPDYVADFLWIHNVQRVLAPTAADAFHPEPWWYFFPVLAATLLPWSPLLPQVAQASLAVGGGDRVLRDYAVTVLVFFSLSSGKLATYVLPAYPALAILTARYLSEAGRSGEPSGRRAAVAGAVLLGGLPLVYVVVAWREAPDLAKHVLAFLPPAVVALAVLGPLRRRMPAARSIVAASATAMTVTIVALHLWTTPALDPHMSDRDLALHAQRSGSAARVVAYRVRPFSFLFYTGWPVTYHADDEERRRTLYAQGRVLVLSEERWAYHLEEIAAGVWLREIARNRRHVLYEVDKPGGLAGPRRARLPSGSRLVTWRP